jgi:hypothetical protein
MTYIDDILKVVQYHAQWCLNPGLFASDFESSLVIAATSQSKHNGTSVYFL